MLVVQSGERGQARCRQIGPRQECRLSVRTRELVPGADGEAVVAAVDSVPDSRAQFVRDRATVLNREIADAAPRIEPIWRGKGIGGANVEAASAGLALLFFADSAGFGCVPCASAMVHAISISTMLPAV